MSEPTRPLYPPNPEGRPWPVIGWLILQLLAALFAISITPSIIDAGDPDGDIILKKRFMLEASAVCICILLYLCFQRDYRFVVWTKLWFAIEAGLAMFFLSPPIFVLKLIVSIFLFVYLCNNDRNYWMYTRGRKPPKY